MHDRTQLLEQFVEGYQSLSNRLQDCVGLKSRCMHATCWHFHVYWCATAAVCCCCCCLCALARFAEDQVFTEVIETQIKAVYLVDGDWYVKLDGDLAGRVTGAVYDASQGDDTLVSIPVSVSAVLWFPAQQCC